MHRLGPPYQQPIAKPLKVIVKSVLESQMLNPEQIVESSTFTIDTTAPTIDAGASLVRTCCNLISQPRDATSLIWSGPAELTFGNVKLAGSTVAANADDPYDSSYSL